MEAAMSLGGYLFAALHVLAIVSCILIRRCGAEPCAIWYRRVFVGLLLVVGMLTMTALATESSSWVFSGSTFTIMAVGSTFDIGQTSVPGF